MSFTKQDLILIIKSRKLSIPKSNLSKMNITQLQEVVCNVSKDELDMLSKVKMRRETVNVALKSKGVENNKQINSFLRQNGINVPANTPKDLMLDLVEDGFLSDSIESFKLDPDQQNLVDNFDKERLIVSAGPGSGKTTTVCHFIARTMKEEPSARILILVFNKCSEKTLSLRIKKIGIKPNLKINFTSGLLINTFDKFSAKITGKTGNFNNYRTEFDAALYKLKHDDVVEDLVNWDLLVIDEAQDVNSSQSILIDELCNCREKLLGIKPRMLIAGDPRQEIIFGAIWFSNLWNDASDDEKYILRYNHRSDPMIVDFLNSFSRLHFPQTHHDQIATRLHSDNNGQTLIEVEDYRISYEISSNLMSCVNPSDIYAIAPVSVDAYNMNYYVKGVRVRVPKFTGGIPVIVHGGNTSLHSNNDCYEIATTSKIKGTERSEVVLFGVEDRHYSYTHDNIILTKLMFVAISRARDKLIIVKDVNERFAIEFPLLTKSDCCNVNQEETINNFPMYIYQMSVTQNDDKMTGLTSTEIEFDVENNDDIYGKCPKLSIDARYDSDFVGIYTEALIAENLGIELDFSYTFYLLSDEKAGKHYCGNIRYHIDDNVVKVGVCCENYKDKLEDIVERALNKKAISNAFRFTIIRFGLQTGTEWTLSDYLQDNEIEYCISADQIASWLKKLGTKVLYQVKKTMNCYTTSTKEMCVEITGILDLLIDDVPVEIKHVTFITNEHRRQAGIYAALSGAYQALLLNIRDGKAEWIRLKRPSELPLIARAVNLINYGRVQNIWRCESLDSRAIKNRPIKVHPNIIGTHIYVDTEYVNEHIIEIGAVAVGNTGVIGVYSKLADGVIELTRNDKPITNFENLCLLRIQDSDVLHQSQPKFLNDFEEWTKSISNVNTLIHWGGKETMFGTNTFDALNKVFRVWTGRNSDIKLVDASETLCVRELFNPHRAFEDALMTAFVMTAITDKRGIL